MDIFKLQPFFDAPVYFSSKGYAGDHCHGHTTTLQVIYTCSSQTVRIFRIAYIGYGGEGGINFNVLCFVFTCYICLISENINTCSCCGKKFQISNLINLDAAQPNLT